MKCPIRQKKANVCLLSFDSQTTLLPLQQSCCCFLFYLTCCVEICSRQRSFLLTTILLFLFYFILFVTQKSAIPMLQLLLFAGLLLLPFNSTPAFIVWGYQKFLLLSESGFLLIEAVMGVLTIMFISQSLVNEIDEHPAVVKVF